LSSMLVALGQRVVRGDVVGRMGNSGWSTGPHLLFEVRRNGVPLDPLLFLREHREVLGQAPGSSAPPVTPATAPSVRPTAPPASKPAASPSKPAAASPQAVSAGPAPADAPAAEPSKEHRAVTDVDTQTAPVPASAPSSPLR
jgi:pyruvate/2-oxoglutarate dehydrogenase complex dihydrolipoamide acyltransferase (E2) component